MAAESLASVPASLRRLALRYCTNIAASSLASIKRLSALEQLTLYGLTSAGGDDALQLLARQLPAGLTSLEFSALIKPKVSGVLRGGSQLWSALTELPCTFCAACS